VLHMCVYIYTYLSCMNSPGLQDTCGVGVREREGKGALNRSVYDIALNTYRIGDEK